MANRQIFSPLFATKSTGQSPQRLFSPYYLELSKILRIFAPPSNRKLANSKERASRGDNSPRSFFI